MSLAKNLKANTPNPAVKANFQTSRRHNSVSPSASAIILNQNQQFKTNPVSKPVPVIVKPTVQPVIGNPTQQQHPIKSKIENNRTRSALTTPNKTTTLISTPKSASNASQAINKSFDQLNEAADAKKSQSSTVIKPLQKTNGFSSNLSHSFGENKKPVSIVSPYGSTHNKQNNMLSPDARYSSAANNSLRSNLTNNLSTKRGHETINNNQQGNFSIIHIQSKLLRNNRYSIYQN